MSHETTRSSSSRSIRRPALPPFLHLTTPQENNHSFNRPGGSKLSIKSFSRAFHHIVFGTVSRLERVTEATVEEENAVYSTRISNSIKRRSTTSRPAPRPSTSSIVSQSTASHISTPRSPRTLIASFPPLNVSDIPPRSPTNKSPFSAVLLAGEDEWREDNPAHALWHTEQLHRARLAKLTSHLGEEVPAELVLSPALLSRSRRGSHHKRASLDPSSLVRESPTEGILRRSKSLKERGVAHRTFSVTDVTPKIPSTEYVDSGVCSAEATTNVAPILNLAPTPSTGPKSRDSDSPAHTPDGGVLHERASADTHSDSPPSRSSGPSLEAFSEASPFSLRAPRATPKPRILPRRPATADANRQVEKLADFFGVDRGDVAQARGIAQELRFSSTSAAGDLAIGIHAPKSQLEVEVKVSKPTRFWKSRTSTKNVHPDDVMDKLRMMRAS